MALLNNTKKCSCKCQPEGGELLYAVCAHPFCLRDSFVLSSAPEQERFKMTWKEKKKKKSVNRV